MKNLKNNWITKDQDTRLYQIPVPIIGLTGGIATGKSTVAQLFREAQIAVIDADQLVKSIYNKKEAHDFVSLHFNEAVENNIINFKKLRALAFKNQTNQSLIENFIYSYLPQQFLEEYNKLSPQNFIIYDVPLLFEKKLDEKIDVSICVYAPQSIQIERLMKRDQIDRNLAETILLKQMDIEEKRNKSDLVIENTADLETLKKNFNTILSDLTH